MRDFTIWEAAPRCWSWQVLDYLTRRIIVQGTGCATRRDAERRAEEFL